MGAHKGRQNRCRSQAGRHTRPSRIKKDTAVHANTTREQGLAFRDTRGSQLPLLPPSRLPTHLKLVSSTSWAPQADKPTHGQAQEGPPGQPQEGNGNRGATSKGGREKERGYFLGIPNLLGSGYEFRGWHFSKERERLAESHKGVQNAP